MSGPAAGTPVTGLAPERWAVVIAVAAGALTLTWVGAALAMSARGLDISDEGYYLLSYRWWSSNPRNASGVQYVYGPLFEALGYSVQALRIARLVTVLGVHLAFAWSFLRWLRVRRPDAVAVPGISWAVALTLTASGGITYGWLPLSPGYNDVAMLGSLVMASAVLCTVAGAAGDGRLPILPAVALGPALVMMVLAKWAAAGVVLAFLVVIAFMALRSWRPGGRVRYLGALAASLLASLAVVDLLVEPFSTMVPPMLEVTRQVAAAAATNSPAQLLPMYLSTTGRLVFTSVAILAVGAPVVALGLLLGRRLGARVSCLLVALGPLVALVTLSPSTFGLPGGGVAALPRYSSALVAMALVVAGVAAYELRSRRRRTRAEGGVHAAAPGRGSDAAVVALLLLLPPVQALGTGNALYDLAVNQIVCWVAAMVLTVLTVPRGTWRRWLAVAATCGAVAVAATTGANGLLVHPYRTTGWAGSSTEVGGTGPLAPLRVSSTEAAMFRGVRTAAGPSPAPGRPVFAFDELPGLVLALDGTSVGEPWYSAIDQRRTAAGIRAECAQSGRITSPGAVVIFDRPPLALDRGALASCGLNVERASATLPLFGTHRILSVYRALTTANKEGS